MSGQGDANKDNTYNLLWIIGGIFAISLIVWHFYGDHLKSAYIMLKVWETKLLLTFFSDSIPLQNLLEQLKMIDPADLSVDDLQDAARKVGKYYLYPGIAGMIFFGATIFRGHVHLRFNKTYDMQKLIIQEQKIYPQIACVVNVDMMKQDMDNGPWAMCTTPMQFCKKYKLLEIECIPNPKNMWAEEGLYKTSLKRSRAERLLASQLGPLWTGIDRLPDHTKALFAIFACRINNDATSARNLTNELAKSAAAGKVNYTLVGPLLKKYKDTPAVKRVLERHAYVSTVMATMLAVARLDGVLATADFLWLKPVDRRLWYILNTVGRQTAPCEVAGIFCHLYAEKDLKQALKIPVLENAIIALEKAIAMIVYEPEPGDEIIDRRGL